MKETVKLIDGTEKEVEVKALGFVTCNNILDEHFKLNGITTQDGGQTIDLKGTSIFKIQTAFLTKGLSGVELDMIDPAEAGRIYKKYYEKVMNQALGTMGGNPK